MSPEMTESLASPNPPLHCTMALCHGIILPHSLRGRGGDSARGKEPEEHEKKERKKPQKNIFNRHVVITDQLMAAVVKTRSTEWA